MNSNSLISLVLLSNNLIQDTTKPQLASFSLNLNLSTISLTFSETVNASSLMIQYITLSDESGIIQYRFAFGTVLSENGVIQVILISNYDLNLIKENFNIATSRSNTYIQITPNLVLDMSDNMVETFSNNSRLQVSNFTNDFIPPVLINSHLDLDSGLIRFIFSEPINILTFTPIHFILLNNLNSSSQYRLGGGNVTNRNWTHVSLQFTMTDFFSIKSQLNLSTNLQTSFFSFSPDFVQDMNANPIFPVLISRPSQFSNYTGDTTPPRLSSYSIDLAQDFLILNFTEPVLPTTLNSSQITFIHPLDNVIYFSLVSSQLYSSSISNNQIIAFSKDDINQLKSLEIFSPQTISMGKIYLTRILVNDTNNNQITTGPSLSLSPSCLYSLTVVCFNESEFFYITSLIIPDTIHPELQRWDLNLTGEEIYLYFSEYILANSLDISQIFIQQLSNISEIMNSNRIGFNSNSSYFIVEDNPIIILRIGETDLNGIKALPDVGTCLEDNNYLSFNEKVVEDIFSNPVLPVRNISALNVTQCVRDFIRPSIINFNLLFRNSILPLILQLFFTETINSSSVNLSQITLSSRRSFDSVGIYQLTGGSISTENSNVIEITVSQFDLSQIRRLDSTSLGINIDSTFIYLTSSFARDMQDNQIYPIPNDTALNVSFPC